jgi:PAS domain S-box-containing protein
MNQLYQALIENCPAGFAYHKSICDNNGNPIDFQFVEVNSAYKKLIGLESVELVGRTIKEVMPDDQFNLLQEFLTAARNGGSQQYQVQSPCQRRWYQVQLFSLENDCFASMITDVTHDLIKLAGSCNEANKTKAQFLTNINHELLTPLNSMLGVADLLAETELSDKQREYVRISQTAGKHLLSLVKEVLDLAKLDSNKLELDYIDFRLPEFVSETVEQFSVKAAKKNLRFDYTIENTVPEYITGDKNRLKQILSHLLDNAIKFTQEGRVSLQVSIVARRGLSSPEVCLHFRITDTGPSIPADCLGKIFSAFYQVDSSATRQNQGSGLGLAIAQKLASLMNGDVTVESTLGVGSSFSVNVGVSVPKKPAVFPEAKGSGRSSLKILLVEDSPDNRFLIEHYMKTTPHYLDIAVNGQVAALKAMNSEYDLILMDIQMPIMDGYQATKEIRAWEARNAKLPVPIVAVTANSLDEDVKKMLANGFDAHLAKPIKKTALLNYIGQYATSLNTVLAN